MVNIRQLHPGDEAILEAFLLPRLETSMFLIGNMRESGLEYDGERYTGDYVAAFEGDRMTAVMAHFWNGIVITQASVHLDALWRETLMASGRPLKGIIGLHEQVTAIKAVLELERYERQLDQCEKLYSLELAALRVPEALTTGQVRGRRAQNRDVDVLTRWRVGYEIETLGEEESEQLWARERAAAEHVVADGNTWILEAGGRPVATSAFNSRIAEAVQIGGVWTPPEFRRRGYARCAVAQSLLDARAEGAQIAILFTGEDNVPAQKAYTALGFRHIGDYYLLMLREPLHVTL
ncbi:MAG: GNAT family N-acetyltransferase [Anaerolineae bacterium]|nr:GNAT family N-acetyltransferase [Anaerolineae bacterium]